MPLITPVFSRAVLTINIPAIVIGAGCAKTPKVASKLGSVFTPVIILTNTSMPKTVNAVKSGLIRS